MPKGVEISMESIETIMTSGASVSFNQSSEKQSAGEVEASKLQAIDEKVPELEVVTEARRADVLLEIAKTEGFEITFKKLSEGDFRVAEEKVKRYSNGSWQEHLREESGEETIGNSKESDIYGAHLSGEENFLDVKIQTLQTTVDKLVEQNQELEEELKVIGNVGEYIAGIYLERAKALEAIAQNAKDEKKKDNWLSVLIGIIANLMKMTMVEDKDLEKQKEAEAIEKLTS